VRVGGQALLLFSDPLKVSILRQLARGPLQTPELSRRLGPASRTTRFSRLRELEGLGVIGREKRGGSPPTTHCMLSPAGAELLAVARRFATWLKRGPEPMSGRSKVADALAIKALASAWGTGILRWLAEGPHSVTELAARGAPRVSYHDVRRARESLADAGLVEPVPSEERGQPYTPTRWAREAGGPIAAAVRWEQRYSIEGAAPLTEVEALTLLLLTVPTIQGLSDAPSGKCALRIYDTGGILVAVEEGRVVSWGPLTDEGPQALVRGAVSAWLDALLDGRATGLQMAGDLRLTRALLAGLQDAWS
jgi:DNA-binding HxlR family transcriptional regulator